MCQGPWVVICIMAFALTAGAIAGGVTWLFERRKSRIN